MKRPGSGLGGLEKRNGSWMSHIQTRADVCHVDVAVDGYRVRRGTSVRVGEVGVVQTDHHEGEDICECERNNGEPAGEPRDDVASIRLTPTRNPTHCASVGTLDRKAHEGADTGS